MRMLVATAWAQGQRANDFHHCVEGELVWIGPVCSADERDPDGACGCGRAFAGMHSHLATTTARVGNVALSAADVVVALAGCLEQQGWNPRVAPALADEMLTLAASYPVGTVLERRLDRISARGRWPVTPEPV
ncbi:DUF7715 family protein [Nakamurella leprariae]|uniref:DUF7715 domain-containing protein n=1 Tax=Nakamurella leprariae TaxID=2803911 RepID=A0A938YF31_9ACTN|nr:hypothetical protein [Nakamurella leprariae]MBM9468418.1 hypothetical protein [Nakamurella leprariae]